MPNHDAALDELAQHHAAGTPIDLDQVQRALRASDAWWSAIFEAAGMGMFFGDISGTLLATTPAVQKMLGYTADEIRKVGVPGITHPDDLEMDFPLFMELVEGKRERYTIEKRYIRADDSVMWGRLTVLLLRDSDDQPQFGIGMLEDITERKEAESYERRLVQARERQQRALELNDNVVQGLIVAKWAHDLGNHDVARAALDNALDGARKILNNFLSDGDGIQLGPGDLVRQEPATVTSPPEPTSDD